MKTTLSQTQQTYAAHGQKERAIWYELKKGKWCKRVKVEGTNDWTDELNDFIAGKYVGHEVRMSRQKGNFEPHPELVVTLRYGEDTIKGTMFFPSGASRMFCSHLDAIRPGQDVQIDTWPSEKNDKISNVLVVDPFTKARLQRADCPTELKEAVSASRQALAAVAKGSAEEKKAKRASEDAIEALDAWIREKWVEGWTERHFGRTDEADEYGGEVDEDTGEVQTSANGGATFEEKVTDSKKAASQEAQRPLAPAYKVVAYDYTTKGFPSIESLGEPADPAAIAALDKKAREREIDEKQLTHIAQMVLIAYGVPKPQRGSAGAAKLVYEFVKNAPMSSIEATLKDEYNPFEDE